MGIIRKSKVQDQHSIKRKFDTLFASYAVRRRNTKDTKDTSSDGCLSFVEELPDDAQIEIYSFLDLASLRQAMAMNHRARSLLLSDRAATLWSSQCRSQWMANADEVDKQQLIDDMHIRTAAGTFIKYNVNIPLLLSMTKRPVPYRVDEELLWKDSSGTERIFDVEREEATGKISKLRYIGESGLSDTSIHSVRSDNPLPCPALRFSATGKYSLKRVLRKSKSSIWKPFVSPRKEGTGLVLTPSLVAYYEVDIHKSPTQIDHNRPFRLSIDTPLEQQPRRDPACIAIGLATDLFDCHTSLPGWDNISFAYHSDNGGLYHGSGRRPRRKQAPPFGAGDTVGCGIDYGKRGIFFTLNGKFIAYLLKDLPIDYLCETRLYPVVGIDSNDTIAINYGSKPFKFDLSSYTEKYTRSMSTRYRL